MLNHLPTDYPLIRQEHDVMVIGNIKQHLTYYDGLYGYTIRNFVVKVSMRGNRILNSLFHHPGNNMLLATELRVPAA